MEVSEKLVWYPPETGCALSFTGIPGGGPVIHDTSSFGAGGAIVGASWTRHHRLWALDFDGVNAHVDCSSRPGLDIAATATIELWFRVSRKDTLGTGTDDHTLLGRDWVPQYTVTVLGPSRPAESIGKADFALCNEAGTWSHLVGDGVVDDSRWHHLAAVWAKPVQTLYIDAVRQSSVIEWNDNPRASSAGMLIGKSPVGRYAKGSLTLVRLYHRVLSALEVQDHVERERCLFDW